MNDTPSSIDRTITLLKIQALLAGAYDLSLRAGLGSPRTDPKFLSYLIKMARMEVGECFDKAVPLQDRSDSRDNLDHM